MAGNTPGVMPAASPGARRRPLVTVVAVVLAALVGAAVVVGVWHSRRPASSPQPGVNQPGVNQAASSAPVGTAAATGCVGGADPVAAVQTALSSPATPDGAAEAAAGVVRFTQSKAFGTAVAPTVIGKIADKSGAGQLGALQQGQAQFLNRMTVSIAHTGRGAFSATPDPLSPTVTVVTAVEWSTGSTQHLDWSFVDVRLLRAGDRWTVVSAQSTVNTPQALQALRGADARKATLDQFGGALSVLGYRRYSGDC